MTDAREHSLPSFGQQVSWMAAARTASVLVTYVIPLVLVRRFDPHEFGLYKQAFLLIGTVVTFLPLGFATSAFYFLPRFEARRGEVVLNILLYQALIGGAASLTLWVWPEVVAAIFHRTDLVPYAHFIAPVVFLGILSSFWESVILANGDIARAAVLFGTTQITKAVLLSAAALLFGSLEALLLAAAAQALLELTVLLTYVIARFDCSPRKFDRHLMWAQVKYALPFGCAGLLFWVQMESHHYIVGRTFGPAIYAIYAVGCLHIPLVGILNDSVASVLIPQVNRLHTQGRENEILALIATALRRLWAAYIPLYVFLLAAGKDLIAWLFTEQYAASWPIFAISLTIVLLTALPTAYDAVIRTYPAYRFLLLRMRLVQAPLVLGAVWLATRRFGPIGAITAVITAAALERVLVAWRLGRDLGLKRTDLAPLGDLRKLSVAAVTAGAMTVLALRALPSVGHGTAFLTAGVVFAAVYLSLGYTWQVFTEGERRAIGAVFARLELVRGK